MAYEDRRPRFNISGTLDSGVSALDTTISSLAFVNLPTTYSSTTYMPITIANDSAGKAERAFIIGHASGSRSVTVVRGMEGDTPQSFAAGDAVRCAPTPWDTQKVGVHAGQTNGFIALGPTPLQVLISAQSTFGGFTVATNRITIPYTGLYRLDARYYITAGSGYTGLMRIERNDTRDNFMPDVFVYKSDATRDAQNTMHLQKALTAGDTLRIMVSSFITAGQSFGSNGYDGTYLELELIQQYA